MTYDNNHYNKKLKARARTLRNESVSKAEKRIWKRLLSRRQSGVRFLRQRAIDNYIVDFFAPEIGLIIEIDGSSHYVKMQEDRNREEALNELGYVTIRFSEGIVLSNLEEVRKIVAHAIYCKKSNL